MKAPHWRKGKRGPAGNIHLAALFVTNEAAAILKCKVALKNHAGNIDEAAASLGVSRGTLYRWIRQHPSIR